MYKKLNFYSVVDRVAFETDDYKIISRYIKGNKKQFAVAKAPNGKEAWRALPSNKRR